jgi:hypothetical protein
MPYQGVTFGDVIIYCRGRNNYNEFYTTINKAGEGHSLVRIVIEKTRAEIDQSTQMLDTKDDGI